MELSIYEDPQDIENDLLEAQQQEQEIIEIAEAELQIEKESREVISTSNELTSNKSNSKKRKASSYRGSESSFVHDNQDAMEDQYADPQIFRMKGGGYTNNINDVSKEEIALMLLHSTKALQISNKRLKNKSLASDSESEMTTLPKSNKRITLEALRSSQKYIDNQKIIKRDLENEKAKILQMQAVQQAKQIVE